MSKDTMNPQDAFIKVLRNWHPTYFSGVFILFLILAVNIDPASPVLAWIQFKLPILTPPVISFLLSLGAFTIGVLRPSPRVVALCTLPAMALAAGTVWYIFAHSTSWIEITLIGTAFFALFGVMFLSAAWVQSLESLTLLVKENAELKRQAEADRQPDATTD